MFFIFVKNYLMILFSQIVPGLPLSLKLVNRFSFRFCCILLFLYFWLFKLFFNCSYILISSFI